MNAEGFNFGDIHARLLGIICGQELMVLIFQYCEQFSRCHKGQLPPLHRSYASEVLYEAKG
jgi:hypothetical protein